MQKKKRYRYFEEHRIYLSSIALKTFLTFFTVSQKKVRHSFRTRWRWVNVDRFRFFGFKMQVYHNSPHLHPKLLHKQECGLHPPISNCCWSLSQMIWALCFISMLSLSSTTDKGVPAHQQLHLMLEISFMHTHTWLYDKRLVKQLLPQCRLATIISIKFSVKRTNKNHVVAWLA